MSSMIPLRIDLKKGASCVLMFQGFPRACVVDRITPVGVHFNFPETGEEKYYRHASIRKLYAKENFWIVDMVDLSAPFAAQLQKKLSLQFLGLPEPQQLAGMKNQWAMKELDSFEARNGSITDTAIAALHEKAKERFGDTAGLSRANLYKLRRLWIQSGGKIEAITPNYQGRGCSDDVITGRVFDLTTAAIKNVYMQKTRPSMTVTYASLIDSIRQENDTRPADDQLKYPSKSYLRDRIKEIDPYWVTEARYGEQVARQKHGGFGRGEVATRPLEVVEIDHTPIDIVAIDDDLEIVIGRVYLTVAIDKCTRCILGFSIDFEKPSYVSVAKCLMHAISFKDYVSDLYPDIKNSWPCFGLMHRILVDRGPEFRSVALEMACCALGISIEYTKKRRPHLKGRVERCFRKINYDRFQTVGGTTFSNYMKRNGYRSEKFAVARVSDIREALHIFVIDDYLQSVHRKLVDKPSHKWLAYVENFPPRMPASQRELNISLAREEKPKQVHHYGVELKRITYGGPGVALIRNHRDYRPKKKYRVKRYDDDLTRIHVLADSGEWIELIAENAADLVGLTAAHFKTLSDFCREELDESLDKLGIANAIVRFREALSGRQRSKAKPKTKAEIREARLKHELDKRDFEPDGGSDDSQHAHPTSEERGPLNERASFEHNRPGSWDIEYEQ